MSALEVNQSYFSSLNKYDESSWKFITNQTVVTTRSSYTYYGCANNRVGGNCTETRTLKTGDWAPTTTLVSPPNGNVTTLNYINFTCNATDDINLANLTFYWNYSGSFIANGTTAVSGTANQTNFTKGSLNNGTILWNCQACDNASQCAFAPANWSVTVNVSAADAIPPLWSANQSSTPVAYSPTTLSQFNTTWTDNIAISTAWIEGNWSGAAQNYSMTNATYGGSIYNYSAVLPAGTFYWKSYANDTASPSNWNASDTWVFTIAKESTTTNLLLNGVANNLTVAYPQQVNATASTTNGTFDLYRNGTNVTAQNSLNDTLGAGYYNFTAINLGNQNYTGSNTTLFATITQATSSVNLTLNGTKSNITLPQGNSINLNCSIITPSTGTLQLYNNGTLINSGNSPIGNLTTFSNIGLYNITCIYPATTNYTTSSETYYVNATDAIAPATDFVSPTETSGSYVNRRYILTNVTALDSGSGLKNITTRVYNSSRSLVSSTTASTSPKYTNFSVSSDGLYYLNATACDNMDNCNYTETRNVTIDTVNPLINFTSPTEVSGTSINRNNIAINVTASNSLSGIKNITIYLYNSTNSLINSTNTSTSSNFIN